MENCPSVVILDSNNNSVEILKLYLEEFSFTDVHSFSDYAEGEAYIKSLAQSSLVFIDIGQDSQYCYNLISRLKSFSLSVIAISSDYSADAIIKAFRYGVKDFLPKPIIKKDLRIVLESVSLQADLKRDLPSKIITIFSNKGGIGKTTIATNLAVEMAKTTGEKVALVDLNLQLGDISTFLNINPTFDVSYVIKNLLDKKEADFLNAFEKYKDSGLYVLSDSTRIESSTCINSHQIEILFEKLKKTFSYIIVDMSAGIDANSLKILDKSDCIVLPMIVNIPAIRNTQRCLTLFDSRNYSQDKIKVIINRYMENDDITSEDIETALAKKIYWKIPNNYFSIMEAINKGVSVSEVNMNSNIAASFKDFSVKISDDIVRQEILRFKGELL